MLIILRATPVTHIPLCSASDLRLLLHLCIVKLCMHNVIVL